MPTTSGVVVKGSSVGANSAPDTARDSQGSAPGSGAGVVRETAKRRNRVRLSCATCRDKKLRCNRQQPCDQCEKRNLGHTCRYIQSVARDRDRSDRDDAAMVKRISELENEVETLRFQLSSRSHSTTRSATVTGDNAEPETPAELAGTLAPAPAGFLGTDRRYKDGENWENVLQDVTQMTSNLRTAEDDDDEEVEVIEPMVYQGGPVLMLGPFHHAHPSLSDIWAWLPDKETTRWMIDRFFKSKEPAWLMFHQPSFYRHFERFWDHKNDVEYTRSWLALLLIMIARAAVFCMRGDEKLPGSMGTPKEVVDEYRVLAARCLALDDYTTPGKWKLQALTLYFGTEYMRTHGAHTGSPILLSLVVRLAVHSGYHRDPKHFPELTPFEGEMRRRFWTVLTEIEVLVNFQFGVPPAIQSYFSDTAIPQNLNDEDFDEACNELPPGRPLSERTTALYTIVKSRLVRAFSLVIGAMAASVSPSWGEVLRLSDRLDKAHNDIPEILKMRPIPANSNEPVDLIMHRAWIELMYQKACIVLHRRYFVAAWSEDSFTYSRRRCLFAARALVKYQFEIHRTVEPSGCLHKHRWFVSSLSTHDFLLANMVLCLELGYLRSPAFSEAQAAGTLTTPPLSVDEIMALLGDSRTTWAARRSESNEALRAYKILNKMLTMSTGEKYDSSPDTAHQMSAGEGVQGVAATVGAGIKEETPAMNLGAGIGLSGSGMVEPYQQHQHQQQLQLQQQHFQQHMYQQQFAPSFITQTPQQQHFNPLPPAQDFTQLMDMLPPSTPANPRHYATGETLPEAFGLGTPLQSPWMPADTVMSGMGIASSQGWSTWDMHFTNGNESTMSNETIHQQWTDFYVPGPKPGRSMQ